MSYYFLSLVELTKLTRNKIKKIYKFRISLRCLYYNILVVLTVHLGGHQIRKGVILQPASIDINYFKKSQNGNEECFLKCNNLQIKDSHSASILKHSQLTEMFGSRYSQTFV